jgi:alanine racemase
LTVSSSGVRPLAARIDLGAVRHNIRFLKGLLPAGCGVMAVVKANAYGHGDVQVARAALQAGATCLGVALVEEGRRLREASFDCDIYLLFEPPPRGASDALEQDLVCSVYTEPYARALSSAAEAAGKAARVHVKIDTGMHRVGVAADDAPAFAEMVAALPAVEVEGLYTHFAVATEPDNPFTGGQMDAFEAAASAIERSLGRELLKHAAASAAVMAFPRSHYGMVRVGIAMLGLAPAEGFEGVSELRPAMTLAGEVALIRRVRAGEALSYGLTYAPALDSWIATLPIGYADGMSRLLSGKADVIIGGKRRPVVGTICMDVCMVDLGDDRVEPGTEFIVIGQAGAERISAEEVARKMGTINYEVACNISARVPRLFIDGT